MSEAVLMSDELVTIATFPEPFEANMARGVLEGAGIFVNMRGESANSLLPVAFETQLQVRAADEVAARAVLNAAPLSEAEVTQAEIAAEGSGE